MDVALAMYDAGIELNLIESMTHVHSAQLLWYWIQSKDKRTV